MLEGILDGFKEVKLNATRSQQISDDLLEASLDAAESRVTAQSELTRNYVFTQNVFFLLLATMVFVVPQLTDIASNTIVKLTTAILFVTSAIAGVVSSVPVFINANASAGNIMKSTAGDRRAAAPAEREHADRGRADDVRAHRGA